MGGAGYGAGCGQKKREKGKIVALVTTRGTSREGNGAAGGEREREKGEEMSLEFP